MQISICNGGTEDEITYVSRNDWEGTLPQSILKMKLTEQMIEDLQDVQYDPDDYEEAKMPTMKAKNGKKLVDMIGLSYDDEAWDELLDQLSFKDMVSLIGDSFHWTMPLESVQAPGTRDENGPQGLTASLIASDKTEMDATAFTSEDVMAATFNRDLMTEIGKVIGNNCLKAGVSIFTDREIIFTGHLMVDVTLSITVKTDSFLEKCQHMKWQQSKKKVLVLL